jgi:hypothetical protein
MSWCSQTAIFAFAFGLSTIPAQSQTIPELAKSHPSNPVVRGRLVDVPKSTMQDLVSGATVILDATLTRSRSYLTANQEDILTDYEIVPNGVLAGSLAGVRTVPGPSAPLILTMYGGDLEIEGARVSVVDYSSALPHNGGRYLLFLQPFGNEGHFQLYRFGAFEIDGSQLKSLLGQEAQRVFSDVMTMTSDEAFSYIKRNAPR